MSFVSRLAPGEMVIDDANAARLVTDGQRAGLSRGYEPRDWSLTGVAQPLDIPLIPRSEWAVMIEERELAGQLLSRVCLLEGVTSKNQGSTNYCWCNAVVTAMEALRAASGLPYVPLSAASVAAPVKSFRNVGGWGTEALAAIISDGICPEADWPANAIDRRYATTANRDVARRYRVTEWYDLQARDFAQVMTCLLLGLPVPVGLLWWGHEVCAIDPVVLGRDAYGVRIRNSWGDGWGEQGFAILTEAKATPDDACAPRVVTVT